MGSGVCSCGSKVEGLQQAQNFRVAVEVEALCPGQVPPPTPFYFAKKIDLLHLLPVGEEEPSFLAGRMYHWLFQVPLC